MSPINYSDYPENWKTEIRPAVLKRGKNCCELCFLKNYIYVLRDKKTGAPLHQSIEYKQNETTELLEKFHKNKYKKIILTIHHIDGDKKNNNMLNLIALCQRCHLKLDMQKHVKKRKMKNDKIKNK